MIELLVKAVIAYLLGSVSGSLLLGRFIFRESELDARAALAVACVVPGVILVSL